MTQQCPICGSNAEKGRSLDYGERDQFDCPRCGRYEISRTARVVLKGRVLENPLLAAVISHRLRKIQSEEEWPLFTTYTMDELSANAELPSAQEQLENLLLHLSDTALHSSQIVTLPIDELTSVLGTKDADGVRYIVDHGIEQRLIREADASSKLAAESQDSLPLGLTVLGWEEVKSLRSKASKKEQPIVPLSDAQQAERLKVFMCHSKDDVRRVKELYAELVKSGANPWFDEEVLLGGHDWELEIKKAVDGAHVFLAFLSKKMVNKDGYVHKELKLGQDTALKKPEGSIYIIPILLDDCEVPINLKKYHWIDLESLTGFNTLMKTLQVRAEELELPTPITIPDS